MTWRQRAWLPDGLYRVETPRFVAGFVVVGGMLVECAPILRKSFRHWRPHARRIGPAESVNSVSNSQDS